MRDSPRAQEIPYIVPTRAYTRIRQGDGNNVAGIIIGGIIGGLIGHQIGSGSGNTAATMEFTRIADHAKSDRLPSAGRGDAIPMGLARQGGRRRYCAPRLVSTTAGTSPRAGGGSADPTCPRRR
jgi:hypothetical protein